MALPVVAIIGRPNVGKSSLLNSLSGQMISIVDSMAGVTRDRVSTIINEGDRYFELVDTGGYGIVDTDALESHVENQIFQAIGSADVVLFMVDIREGVVPLDQTIAALLRKHSLQVILVANKADSPKQLALASEFLKLGFGEPICISAANLVNRAALMERICQMLDHLPCEKPAEAVMKLAVVGKRNAGKSTFINAVVGQERVIVSDVPGTTRDAVDVRFEKDGRQFIIIDTAGVRKIGKMQNDIEYYGYTRVTRSIRRADVILFMMDAATKISQVDKKLCALICQENKPCVIVVNKWDLVKNQAAAEDYADYLSKVLVGIRHAPIAFTTAKDGKNIQSVLDLAAELFKQASAKIPTARLNKAVEMLASEKAAGSRKKAGIPKIYYAAQVASNPVCILLFVNNPALFDQPYQRFIISRLGELLGLEEVPIRLLLRRRS
ncbi:MAG TPA: ribosome biogenesis GTPase Der [Anaerohalosphaeraceae bacterium]|nr:ribosome biogenesis GTPase Der [Phycisphaerae bacterium]HOK94858.1 ribosome biogenesis GTPase Der [Anaerohalosphaeraceae bacterium]HOL30989.1 ribosome biogenesis GTPase Der [Anaerohalosphaeraceae bacterium]HOM76251.1 ribosome biogenesis GTPase Der [Anaerohalosphaeraceae bacterium]HPC63366.1 ribosome biogenesis GTPase Der [Anaerohalosphaeraceae bacterium]